MELRRFQSLLGVPRDDPELALAQFRAFASQIPALYSILLVDSVALALSHLGVAPPFLTVVVPTILCIVCLARVLVWRRSTRKVTTGEQAARRLRATLPPVALLGGAFTAWSLSLYPYGDAYTQCHVAYFMSITVISCIFCLMYLLSAALLLSAIVIIPSAIFFCLSGHFVLAAISLNFLLAASGMLFVLVRNYHDFVNVIVSRRELSVRQAETERLGEENLRLANLDSLTDLPNRRSFLDRLETTLVARKESGRRFSLMLIDLDGFKDVNDLHGHSTGDRLLVEVGERLKGLAGPDVFAARLGGDEFGVILSGDGDDAALKRFADALCDRLRMPYIGGATRSDVSGSAGIASYPDNGDTTDMLLEKADYALYSAKASRKGQAVIFSAEHDTRLQEASTIEHALRRADLCRELHVVFQPIVDASSGEPISFETLARWTSPELGVVSPDKFIRAAETLGMVSQMTEILLPKALEQAARWPETISLSFNLSAHDLVSTQTMAAIMDIISESGIAPNRLHFEITETAVMHDFDQARDMLATLRRLGSRISLDDFGTGYSSLSQVHRLPLDTIKIDRSFVSDIMTDGAFADIVKTIVSLCRTLNLGCVVEGVETEAQRNHLLRLGCRSMQGYLFARPMRGDDVLAYLEANAGDRRYA